MLKMNLHHHVIIVLMFMSMCIYNANAKYSGGRGLILSQDSEKYAVIFDGGSTGSRVNVFHFDANLDLIKIGQDFEYYEAVKPGLSSYANDPQGAANSLEPLLNNAENLIPKELLSQTPLKLGATAGLRLLDGDASDLILEAVRNLMDTKSSLQYKAEWITLLDGSDEGAYMWVAINYLLGKLGKNYPNTVGTIDLGGGSIQVAYAISDETNANAPQDVQAKYLKGTNYNLYVHSYLNYGLMAARAQILKASNGGGNPCILSGYDGTYEYNGETYKVSPTLFGPNLKKCRKLIKKVLKVDAICTQTNCTFDGVWNGGGGDGTNNLYLASYFYDIAVEVGIIDKSVTSAISRPKSYLNAAKVACNTKYKDAKSTFPNAWDSDLQFLCMDLIYEFSLVVDGLGVDPKKEVTIAQEVKYKNSLMGAAWPLGSAIDAVSSSTSATKSLASKTKNSGIYRRSMA